MSAPETLAQLRASRANAEHHRRSLLGELVEVLRASDGKYPRRVGAVLEKITRTEARIEEATAAIGQELEHVATETLADIRARDHVNALVAVYVEGLEVVPGMPAGRWSQVDPTTEKHRPIPNYAADYSAARRALERFAHDYPGLVHPLAERLGGRASTWPAVAGVLMASPAAICEALLEVMNVSPTADVPIIAE